jgi:hypothetical protein
MAFLSFLEKLKIISVVLKDKSNTELNIGFSTLHNIEDICKCKFRFYHPELSHMTTCMRNLSPKGRAKSINI